MTLPAHMLGVSTATTQPAPVMVPVDQIASVGHSLTDFVNVPKVQRMRRKLKAGGVLPPVCVTPLTPELRDRVGVDDLAKKYYLESGHHRLAASKLEGLKKVRAVSYHGGKRL